MSEMAFYALLTPLSDAIFWGAMKLVGSMWGGFSLGALAAWHLPSLRTRHVGWRYLAGERRLAGFMLPPDGTEGLGPR